MTLNGNNINLPSSVVIPLRETFRMRKLLRRQLWYFHVMLKQGKTWFTLEQNDRNPCIKNTTALKGRIRLKKCNNLKFYIGEWPGH